MSPTHPIPPDSPHSNALLPHEQASFSAPVMDTSGHNPVVRPTPDDPARHAAGGGED